MTINLLSPYDLQGKPTKELEECIFPLKSEFACDKRCPWHVMLIKERKEKLMRLVWIDFRLKITL